MSRIQVVKPHASAYSNFYGQTRKSEATPLEKETVVVTEKAPSNDVLDELKESRKLNETLRNELQQVIRFNVALQQEIEALHSREVEKNVIVHSTVPRDNTITIGPFFLSKERTYVIESHLTCVNIDMVDECGTVLGICENGHLFGTGAAAWSGRVNTDDDNPYGGVHTVCIRALFTPSETKEYVFTIKEIGKKHTQILLNHPDFPCITTIL